MLREVVDIRPQNLVGAILAIVDDAPKAFTSQARRVLGQTCAVSFAPAAIHAPRVLFSESSAYSVICDCTHDQPCGMVRCFRDLGV